MKKHFLILFGIIAFLTIIHVFTVNASTYETNYSTGKITPKDATFVIQVLKYEPFPVNPGDWFNLWVKVQNIGQDDAKDAKFQLITNYPFSSNDTPNREYGIVSGIANAYKNKNSGDVDIEINQVIMKFRVKVADNAPEGGNTIQLKANAYGDTGSSIAYDLPIEIGKTKTDFDLAMQDSTSQGISFAIANIGENPANAIIVSIPEQQGIVTKGTRSSILGNLDKGDFTTVTFQVTPQRDVKEMTLQIAYTDLAGVRNTIEKKVLVDVGSQLADQTATGTGRRLQQSTAKSLPNVVYIGLGIFIGIILLILIRKVKRKIKGSKHENK